MDGVYQGCEPCEILKKLDKQGYGDKIWKPKNVKEFVLTNGMESWVGGDVTLENCCEQCLRTLGERYCSSRSPHDETAMFTNEGSGVQAMFTNTYMDKKPQFKMA